MKLKLSKTARIMCGALCGLFVVILAAGLAVSVFFYPFEQPGAFAVGLTAGIAHSIAKVILLEKSLGRAADMADGKSARNYGVLQAVLRYFLTILVMLLVVFFPRVFGMIGTIAGILSLQLAAYIAGYILRRDTTEV